MCAALGADRPTEKDLELIRTRKAEQPKLDVTLKDGSHRELWCTFGPQQIDINIASPSGRWFCSHACTAARPSPPRDREPAPHLSQLRAPAACEWHACFSGIPLRVAFLRD